ncbi:MAG: alpha/beta hydrolase [Pseudomonadota bacterium]
MQLLFVHGMGRTPLSGWPMLRHLRRAGLRTGTFGYMTSVEDASAIGRRLAARLADMGTQGDYAVIGHSLGGVLLRMAIATLPADVQPPRHLFLLGSPIGATRLAGRLQAHPVYRVLTRDCGQMLASAQRMASIGPASVPVTSVIGMRGLSGRRGPFGGEPNDGVVALSEVEADWIGDQVRLPLVHTLLPASARVAGVILDRLGSHG